MFNRNFIQDSSPHEIKNNQPLIPIEEIISPFPLKEITSPSPNSQPEWKITSNDVNGVIWKYLPAKDLYHLAKTCRLFYHPLQTSLNHLLKECIYYSFINPNAKKITTLLERSGADVLKIVMGTAIPNQRLFINNTLFQLAYGASATAVCLAMKPFFSKAYGSEEAGRMEMMRQIKEKFSEDDGMELEMKENSELKKGLMILLEPVIKAITQEEFKSGKDAEGKIILSDSILTTIEFFRKKFSETQRRCIESGLHFCDNILLEILDVYAEATIQWRHHYMRCSLFEDGVLSYVLSFLPSGDAQKFSQGLYYQQTYNPEPARESLLLREGENNIYEVLSRFPSSTFSILRGCCVDINRGTYIRGGSQGDHANSWKRAFLNLCKTKIMDRKNLCGQLTHNQQPSHSF